MKGMKPTPGNIWKSYQPLATTKDGDIFAPPVNSVVGNVSQFYLRYLAILEDRVEFINKVLLGEFWRNECPFLYAVIFNPDGKGRWTSAIPDLDLEQYHARMTRLLLTFADRLQDFTNREATSRAAIKAMFDSKSKDIVSKIARRVFSERLASSAFSEMNEPLTRAALHNKLCRDYLDAKRASKPAVFPPSPPYLYAHIKDYVF